MKILFIILLTPLFTFAQISFQNTYGGSDMDIGHSVEQTSDGGYIVLGQSQSFSSSQDLYLFKTDQFGNEVWSKTYGSVDWEWGISVKQTTDGGYILCGGWSGLTNDSLVLLKTDNLGNEEWNYRFTGSIDRDVGQSVIETSDGGYAACGFTAPYPNEDVFVIKTNNLGVQQWSKVFSGPNKEVGRTIRQTSDDGFFVLGSTNSYGAGERDLYLLRLNSIGDTLWTKTYGTLQDEEGTSMHINNDGTIALIGYEYFNGGNIYALKADANGSIIWDEYYGGNGWDMGYSIKQTNDDGFVLSGRKDNTVSGGTHDMYCIKTNAGGVVEWEYSYPYGLSCDATCIQQTTDGGYVMTGSTTEQVTFDSDVILLKLPGNGILNITETQNDISVETYPNPFVDKTTIRINGLNDQFSIVVRDSQGKLLVSQDGLDDEVTLNAMDLSKGLNLFEIISNNTTLAHGKIILQ